MTNAPKVLLSLTLLSVPLAAATTCESLTSLSLPDTTITSAQVVAAGSFVQPGKAPAVDPYKSLPAFCRVTATIKPTNDSDIRVEVWLPNGWNRNFEAVGNGGWAGSINYGALADSVKAGYASASTDTGHVGDTGDFALGHPEKLIDYGWRSEHEMTVKAKAVIQAFYGSAPRFSYWNGCSGGGRQALKEAQRFPGDFDGIVAGAPGNRTQITLWVAHALLKDPNAYIPPSKYPMIHAAAINACDASDGLKDGLIGDPVKCRFDPKVLLCKDQDGPSCLTAPQVDAVRKMYLSATNPRTGREYFPTLVPGTELGWGVLGGGPAPYMVDHFRNVVFKDRNWDWRTFNWDSDVALAEQPENVVMNATDPNLKPFFAHNGKLLIYQGWSDPQISALNTIKYYNSVVDTLGGASKTTDNIRLFMAPGMGHCRGGDGPNEFDKMADLERWVRQGKAPEKIVAAHRTDGKVDRTRPLCPYPQVAKYKGSGNIDDAANFVCRVP